MSTNARIMTASQMEEGMGAEVRRLFPIAGCRNHDPFVLWDHFSLKPGTGFPPHPHRGFEAITYVFEGSMEHNDNLGNLSIVGPGGAQRFTAGKGIVHSEMPHASQPTRGIQLWINLPQRLKSLDPGYQAVDAEDIPETALEGGRRRTIVGPGSPLHLNTKVDYFELYLEAGGNYEWQYSDPLSGFIYMVDGELMIEAQILRKGDAYLAVETKAVSVSSENGAHVMVCFGRPHGEPIYQHGTNVD
jgi:redox-sensitive bicupin YhaK (pirin superfamily)